MTKEFGKGGGLGEKDLQEKRLLYLHVLQIKKRHPASGKKNKEKIIKVP